MNISVKNITAVLLLAGITGLTSCSGTGNSTKTDSPATVVVKPVDSLPSPAGFQKVVDGKKVDLYYLKNKNGMKAAITSFGGRLVSLFAPDKSGKMVDVVVGFDSLHTYQVAGDSYGATVGRYGNRIAKAKFTLEGKVYNLSVNNNGNTLHGGKD